MSRTYPISAAHNHDNVYLGLAAQAADAHTVDGAHASATPTATTIPVADVGGKLAVGWVPTGIDHGGLAGLTDDDHTQYIKHSLATAVSDFVVASGAGAFVKKTLAEVKTILGLGSAAYTASTDYLPVAAKAADSDLLDNHDTAYFATAGHDHAAAYLGIAATAADSDKVDGAHASATPTATTIPIADANGKLDGWVSSVSGLLIRNTNGGLIIGAGFCYVVSDDFEILDGESLTIEVSGVLEVL